MELHDIDMTIKLSALLIESLAKYDHICMVTFQQGLILANFILEHK